MTHSGPCAQGKHHKSGKVAAGEVQDLPACSHQLGLGLICKLLGGSEWYLAGPITSQADNMNMQPQSRHSFSKDTACRISYNCLTLLRNVENNVCPILGQANS